MRLLAAASLFLSITTSAAVPEVEDLGKRQGNGSAPVSVIPLSHPERVAAKTLKFPNSVYPNATEPYAESGAKSFQNSPPKYPSPWVDTSVAGNWSAAIQRAKAFVAQLTLLEKVNLTTGVG